MAVDLTTGYVVFSRHADTALVPASNEKLPVTYAALRVLGPSFRFATEARGLGSLDEHGTWNGSLVLKGYGDPTLSTSKLRRLVKRLRGLGIRHVAGSVIGDESFFDRKRTVAGWKPGFYLWESPPLSALVVDRGSTRTGVTRTPAYAAAKLFRQLLAEGGIAVDGRAKTVRAGGRVLARVVSEPLGEILHAVDADSDNFTAELLLKEIGAVAGEGGTSAAGAAVVRRVLGESGIPLTGVRIVDGSGLSSLDRLTAQAIVGILQHAWTDRALQPFVMRAMAVAGYSGTMRRRLLGPRTRGVVLGKTGTTDLASVLSGYVRGRYAFAVIQNGRPVATWSARAAQDRFVELLARAPG